MAPPVVKKIFVRGMLGLLGAIVVAYVIDAVQLRVRLSMGGPAKAYDTVSVTGRLNTEPCGPSW